MKFKYDKQTNTLTLDFEGAEVIFKETDVLTTDVEGDCPVLVAIENGYFHFGEHNVKKAVDQDVYAMLDRAHDILKNNRPNTPGLGAPISLIKEALYYLKARKNNYWKQRCLAAEAYIDETPCDHDIHYDQHNAYLNWQKIKDEENS